MFFGLHQMAGYHGRDAHNKVGWAKRAVLPMRFPLWFDEVVSEGKRLYNSEGIGTSECSQSSRRENSTNTIKCLIHKSGGIRTPSSTSNSSLHSTNKTHTKQAQKLAKSDTYKKQKKSNLNKTSTSPEQDNNTFLHKKCAICVHQNLRLNESDLPAELIELISVWSKLSEYTKSLIRTLIKAGGANKKK